ncbi:STM2901 family protein [Cupriavidus sp. 2KB_3]|uniref:STM2901 family protein n=1 Tax=Cupriavidus TaxID=106589 RepID=UPI0011EEF922|nr:hypothetical protein [Cupriavidus campinensis]
MGNTYRYGVHENLTPSEMLLLITIDETCKQLGVEDFATVGAILVGQNWIPTRGKFKGATPRASVASKLSRTYLDYDLKRRILPTVTNASLKMLKMRMTRNIGVFVGRSIPILGWALLARDVSLITVNSVRQYHLLVKNEDRVF